MKHLKLFEAFGKKIITKPNYVIFTEQHFPGKKIAYYHRDKDEWEYRGKFRKYNVSSTIASFCRTKDLIILVDKKIPFGFINGSVMSSHINILGSVYRNEEEFKYIWEEFPNTVDIYFNALTDASFNLIIRHNDNNKSYILEKLKKHGYHIYYEEKLTRSKIEEHYHNNIKLQELNRHNSRVAFVTEFITHNDFLNFYQKFYYTFLDLTDLLSSDKLQKVNRNLGVLESKFENVIAYDFDGTLHLSVTKDGHPLNYFANVSTLIPNIPMMDQMKRDSENNTIIVVSARDYGDEKYIESFCQLYKLPVSGVYCTNDNSKLNTLLDLNVSKIYDDNLNVKRDIEETDIEFCLPIYGKART